MAELYRPSWDEYFLNIARLVSLRSPDAQTKHGCVLVNKDKKIVGTGFNGFPKGMDDVHLPRVRPEKYPWMIHSEINALLNRTVIEAGCTAYVTGQCCRHCLFCLHQAGITEVVMEKAYGSVTITEKDLEDIALFIEQTGLKVRHVCSISYLAGHLDRSGT